MNPTRIQLSEDARAALARLLNLRLAQAVDLKLQAKQAHWNVKGPHFQQLHELFDSLATQADTWADNLAERAVQLGGVAEGTVQAVGTRTTLAVYPLLLAEGNAHTRALADALGRFANDLRTGIDDTAKLGDAVTSDLLTGMAGEVDKTLWFFEAHLHG